MSETRLGSSLVTASGGLGVAAHRTKDCLVQSPGPLSDKRRSRGWILSGRTQPNIAMSSHCRQDNAVAVDNYGLADDEPGAGNVCEEMRSRSYGNICGIEAEAEASTRRHYKVC